MMKSNYLDVTDCLQSGALLRYNVILFSLLGTYVCKTEIFAQDSCVVGKCLLMLFIFLLTFSFSSSVHNGVIIPRIT